VPSPRVRPGRHRRLARGLRCRQGPPRLWLRRLRLARPRPLRTRRPRSAPQCRLVSNRPCLGRQRRPPPSRCRKLVRLDGTVRSLLARPPTSHRTPRPGRRRPLLRPASLGPRRGARGSRSLRRPLPLHRPPVARPYRTRLRPPAGERQWLVRPHRRQRRRLKPRRPASHRLARPRLLAPPTRRWSRRGNWPPGPSAEYPRSRARVKAHLFLARPSPVRRRRCLPLSRLTPRLTPRRSPRRRQTRRRARRSPARHGLPRTPRPSRVRSRLVPSRPPSPRDRPRARSAAHRRPARARLACAA
jgi:hypothetical protein